MVNKLTFIFEKYKKQCIATGIVVAVVLIMIYLRALFLPGLWHGDAFLYRQEDGSFKGSDIYAEYSMTVSRNDYGAEVDFSVNDKVNHYTIKSDEKDYENNVEISENNVNVFKGKAIGFGDEWMLSDENNHLIEIITVHSGEYVPQESELFPSYTKLYNWSVSGSLNTRGEPYMLFFIALFGLMLFLDIKFPTLFWILEHRLEVDGGEPSDWYLFSQKVGRVIFSVGIFVCMVLTFTLH